MMTRRELLSAALCAPFARMIPLDRTLSRAALRFAVITDLHHGLAPDAMMRLSAFVQAVKARNSLDAVLQLGDFCHAVPESQECVDLFNTMPHPKLHVLGNHDMDKCDKASAMKFWGMTARYGSQVIGGYRFLWLDLNNFKKDGKLVAYEKGNYFTDGATHNWADPEQLQWLQAELKASAEPVVLLSHQPLGFADAGVLPPEQQEVMSVIESSGAVAVSLFGHLHVDRMERPATIPYLCVNSASYFWHQGMRPYTLPLFAFMEIANGFLKIEGVQGEFVSPPPADSNRVVGRSASIGARTVHLPPTAEPRSSPLPQPC